MSTAAGPRHTPLYERHVAAGARMVDFAGWDMPLNYPDGVVAEHLATRRSVGLFDVSHMGRFVIGGPDAVPYLQRILTNDAAALPVGRSHYTLFSTPTGMALDDAYLCRFVEHEFVLVVNAANRLTDWDHMSKETGDFRVDLEDRSEGSCMLSLQGPASQNLLSGLLEAGSLPNARRNSLAQCTIAGTEVLLSRTGYTGEPLCFEIIVPAERVAVIWDLLVAGGASPVGLGARDTLRLEAGLPLYGHEQGIDPEGRDMPLLSCPVARYGVSLSEPKRDFIGRTALARQRVAYDLMTKGDYSRRDDLPRLIRPVAVTGRGVARAGSPVMWEGRQAGWITSGTMVPYWTSLARGKDAPTTEEHGLRSICLAYVDSQISTGDELMIDIRGKEVEATVVDRHLSNDRPPYARPVIFRGP